MTYHFLNTIRTTKGTHSLELELSDIVAIAKSRYLQNSQSFDEYKHSLPIVITTSVRSVFEPTDWYFIDIDTTEGADTVVSQANQLFQKLPFVAAVGYSASKKLHIHLKGKISESEEEWSENYRIYSIATLHVIKELFGIDYFSAKHGDKDAFDLSSSKYTQVLYISHYDIVENLNWEKIDITADAQKLKSLYPKYWNTKQIRSKSAISGKATDTTDRIAVDRNLKVGNYSGNELRWRISVIAYNLFGDSAKEWCDSHFYCKEGSIYSLPSSDKRTPNTLVYNWLVEKGFIVSNDSLFLSENQYLSDITDKIVETIDSHDCNLEIVAPTGTGKTRLINDPNGLAFRYNAVVLVPYNVTNALYPNLSLVSSTQSEDRNREAIASGKPIVCVFDQYLKYSGILTDRVVIVDEAHLVFTSRNFRDVLADLLVILKNRKKILFTATREGEADYLDIPVVEVSKKSKTVYTTVIDKGEGNSFYEIAKQIDNEAKLNNFDTVCIFDDRNARAVESYLKSKGLDTIVFRKDTKERPECKQLLKEEVIKNKWFVGTNLSFQGLNFNNTGKVLVISVFREGESFISDIYQEIGRFRKAESVSLITITCTPNFKSVDQQQDEQNRINEAYDEEEISVYNRTIQISESKYSVLKELEEYNSVFCTIDKLLERFYLSGFVVYTTGPKTECKGRFKIAEREAAEQEFLSALKKGDTEKTDPDRYYLELLSDYCVVSRRYTDHNILSLFENKDSKSSFSVFLSQLAEETRYVQGYSLEQLVDFRSTLQKATKKYKSDKVIYRVFRDQLKSVSAAIAIYDLNCDDCYKKLFTELEVQKESVIAKCVEGGKKGGSVKKQLRNTKTGEIYQSCADAQQQLGVAKNVISRYIKTGKLEVVD